MRLAKTITTHRSSIQAALTQGLSNGLVESTNTKIRVLTRVAFGFRSPEALIARRCSASAAYAHRCQDGHERPTETLEEPY